MTETFSDVYLEPLILVVIKVSDKLLINFKDEIDISLAILNCLAS